jgi:hypothetical protein
MSKRSGTTDYIGRGKNTWPSIFQGSRKQSFSLHQSPFSVACNTTEMSETASGHRDAYSRVLRRARSWEQSFVSSVFLQKSIPL